MKKEFQLEKDELYKEISELKTKLNDKTPVIDTMKMTINLTYAKAVKKRSDYYYYGSYNYYDTILTSYPNITEINIDMQGGLFKQVRRIIKTISEQIVNNTFEKFKDYRTEKMSKELIEAHENGKKEEKDKIIKMKFFERIKYLND